MSPRERWWGSAGSEKLAWVHSPVVGVQGVCELASGQLTYQSPPSLVVGVGRRVYSIFASFEGGPGGPIWGFRPARIVGGQGMEGWGGAGVAMVSG